MIKKLEQREAELARREKKGFTLMEMLIVVAIIAILVAIAIPVFTSQLNNARVQADAANIRSGYAAATAAVLSDNVTETTTYVLNSDGTVEKQSGSNTGSFTTQGDLTTSMNSENIGGQTFTQWSSGSTVTYTYNPTATTSGSGDSATTVSQGVTINITPPTTN